ncbi:hypothetical protein ANCDUO_17656, partial [Ancylostoma duodenale]
MCIDDTFALYTWRSVRYVTFSVTEFTPPGVERGFGFSSSVGLFSARATSSTMSTSGVMVNPDVQTTFQKLSEGKKEFRYIIFKIE